MSDRKTFDSDYFRLYPVKPPANGVSQLQSIVITALSTALITGIGFFLLLPRNVVTRDDVSRMMQTEGPYIEDREAIKQTLHDHGEKLGRLDENLELLMRSQGVTPVPQQKR